jgi:hypothetical protein
MTDNTVETPKEFKIEITISDKNMSYKSDFSEPDTIFWIDAVKYTILKKTFDATIQES